MEERRRHTDTTLSPFARSQRIGLLSIARMQRCKGPRSEAPQMHPVPVWGRGPNFLHFALPKQQCVTVRARVSKNVRGCPKCFADFSSPHKMCQRWLQRSLTAPYQTSIAPFVSCYCPRTVLPERYNACHSAMTPLRICVSTRFGWISTTVADCFFRQQLESRAC